MGNTPETNETIKAITVGVGVAIVLCSLFGYFAISFFKRILEDIKNLFGLYKDLKCTEHAERLGYLEGKTDGKDKK